MNPAASGLGYDAAPALSTPLRFFLTAPVFGIAAGLLLILSPALLESRWTPGALAITHLMTVGFMLMVMIGALFQVLPVVCGAAIPAVRVSVGIIHTLLLVGAATLAGGLFFMAPNGLLAASWLLGAGLAGFMLSASIALLRAPSASGSQRDMRLALVSLGIAIMLGLSLAMTIALGLPLPLSVLLELHAGWGLLGGAGVLLAATSWIVVPMFQITPPYPKPLTRFWALGFVAALMLWSAAVTLDATVFGTLLLVTLLCFAATFLVITLRLLGKTRRSAPDASFRIFMLGISSLLAGMLCLIPALIWDHPVWPLLTGVLVIYGGFVSVIQGMLYKIVPFLAWLHLTQSGIKAPNVKRLQPETSAKRQLLAHTLAVVVLLIAVASGSALMVRVAGLLVVFEFGWLLLNMLGVLGNFRRALREQPQRLRTREA